MEKFLLEILGLHQEELYRLGWQSGLVLIAAEFVARLYMVWYDVKNPDTEIKKRNLLSRAIGLSANGIVAFLFVISLSIAWDKLPFTVLLYGGLTMIGHYALDKWVIQKYFPKLSNYKYPVEPPAPVVEQPTPKE